MNSSDQKQIDSPLCELRAKSHSDKEFTVLDYDMYIKEKKASTYSCPIPVDEVYNYSDIYRS